MNLLPILLGLIMFSGFNKKDKNKQSVGGLNLGDLSGILSNPDAIGLLPHVTKLFDKNASEEDKNAAMMALMTNPAVFEIMQKFTSKKDDGQDVAQDFGENSQQENSTEFSAESKEFFKPVENVAGVEISQKLYKLYDNWYIKK